MYNTIELKNIFKDNTLPKSADIVLALSNNLILNKETIIIDMEGVSSLSTSFMNVLFKGLIDRYGLENTKKSFSFKNIRPSEAQRIKSYFDRFL